MDYGEPFDVVLFFGILYHLRYPVWGLKCVLEALKPGGLLLIETALFIVPVPYEVIYCPVKGSPYEPTSCSFFNEQALRVTLASMGCDVESVVEQEGSANEKVSRFFIVARKTREMAEPFRTYWEGEHHFHSSSRKFDGQGSL
jgi:SAM-dependent methyltransferase